MPTWKRRSPDSFDPARTGLSPETGGRRSTPLLLAGLRDDYPSDRVAAFVGGLGNMLYDAFDGKAEFFVLDDLDAQTLYNAARNVELAAWKLANARRIRPRRICRPARISCCPTKWRQCRISVSSASLAV